MKILVLSDSHSALSFMEECVEAVKPDAILHLGDYYDDGETLRDLYPKIRFLQVPGNCDAFRCDPRAPQVIITKLFGVNIYMTHGHLHYVKSDLYRLLRDAREAHVDVVLYGHTHIDDCHLEEDGLWVMNPGTCGYGCRTAGLIETEDDRIKRCRILRSENLEEFR